MAEPLAAANASATPTIRQENRFMMMLLGRPGIGTLLVIRTTSPLYSKMGTLERVLVVSRNTEISSDFKTLSIEGAHLGHTRRSIYLPKSPNGFRATSDARLSNQAREHRRQGR